MRHDRWALTPDELTTLGKIVTRFPGLASAVHAQVTRLIQTTLADGRPPTRAAEVDALLEKVVDAVVARSREHRRNPPSAPDETTDSMVLLLARNSVTRARPRLLEDLPRPPAT